MKHLILFAGITLLLSGCFLTGGYKYNAGTFPENPVNLGDINSTEDDYNSDIPDFGSVLGLVFSSKRNGGNQFDFVNQSLNYDFNRTTGKFTFNNTPYGGLDIVDHQRPLAWAATIANSSANELGPYISSYDGRLLGQSSVGGHLGEYLMLFASDRTGDLDIYLTHNYQTTPPVSSSTSTSSVSNKLFNPPVAIPCLNSKADDAYPTFDQTFGAVYFTSNRGGTFDIFRATLPAMAGAELQNQLPSLTNVPIERVNELSSAADDKCPYIAGNWLVFTSNRPGGYGGYDLYYSKLTNGGWSTPVNFGPTINTAADEYRPILHTDQLFSNQLMIFSSNRPGGKGGFDLYMVGVPK